MLWVRGPYSLDDGGDELVLVRGGGVVRGEALAGQRQPQPRVQVAALARPRRAVQGQQ